MKSDMKNNLKYQLLLLFTLSTVRLYAVDSLNVSRLSFSYGFWFSAHDICAAPDRIYIASRNTGMRVVNVSDPCNPFEESVYYPPDYFVWDVEAIDSIAYVACGNDEGMRVVDVSDPTYLVELGFCPTGGRLLTYSEGFIYAVNNYEGQKKLHVIDVVNPASPIEVASCSLAARGIDIAVDSNRLVIAAGEYGIITVDISSPLNPVCAGRYNTSQDAISLAIKDNYAIVMDSPAYYMNPGYILVVDITDLTNPSLSLSLPYYLTNDVALQGNYAFVTTFEPTRLKVLDITDPPHAFELSSMWLSNAHCIDAFGEFAYIGYSVWTGGNGHVKIIDISPPQIPVEICDYSVEGYLKCSAVIGNYVYLADNTVGMRIVNISDPANPVEEGIFESPAIYGYGATGMDVWDNYVFLACGYEGLRIINVTEPQNPHYAWTYDTTGYCVKDVWIEGDAAYVIGTGGLTAYQISNPSSPSVLGNYNILGDRVWVYGRYAFVGYGREYDVYIVDISDPSNMTQLGYYHGHGVIYAVTATGDYMYCSDNDLTVIIDISDPSNPIYVNSVYGSRVSDAVLYENLLVLARNWTKGIQLFDISDPINPVEVGYYEDTAGDPSGLSVSNSIAYMAEGCFLGIYDFSACTSVDYDKRKEIPTRFCLHSPAPNPFNPTSFLRFDLPKSCEVTLTVYDIAGREAAVLADGYYTAGTHRAVWEASGRASGVYLARLEAGAYSETVKLLLVK